jgi:hypothetical protein
MAISTYAQLQTAVGNWLNKSNLAAVIPDFISLAEAKLNRQIRTLSNETIRSLSTSTASQFVTIPLDVAEIFSLAIIDTAGETVELQFVSPVDFSWVSSITPNEPEKYTIRDQIELDVISDQVYTLKAHVRTKWDIATTSTNWLLTNAPDVYLYGALCEAEPYLKNDARVGTWKQLYEQAVAQINELAARTRTGNSTLMVDSGLTSTRAFNINRGD